MTTGTSKSEQRWRAGYYHAVAALVKMEGRVTNSVYALFGSGGPLVDADADDVELFRQFGLDGDAQTRFLSGLPFDK